MKLQYCSVCRRIRCISPIVLSRVKKALALRLDEMFVAMSTELVIAECCIPSSNISPSVQPLNLTIIMSGGPQIIATSIQYFMYIV